MWVPLEKYENIMLANRLDNYNYRFSAIRNESDKLSFAKGKKRKKEWVRPGIPDFCLILKRWAMCFIELKRQRPIWKKWQLLKSPSNVSEEQLVWIALLKMTPNVYASICYWAREAIEFIIESEAR